MLQVACQTVQHWHQSLGAAQEGEEGEEDDSDDSSDRERITDVSELARMASRGEPNVQRVSPIAAVRHRLGLQTYASRAD